MILTTNDKIPRPVAQMRGSRRTCVLQLAATIAAYLSGYAVSSAQVSGLHQSATAMDPHGCPRSVGARGLTLSCSTVRAQNPSNHLESPRSDGAAGRSGIGAVPPFGYHWATGQTDPLQPVRCRCRHWRS